ncbi:MAG: 50S ribosomal protein L29 [Xanthomonadales bacterium]|nr:50S ribosomal protein L29 [Xanthomonadales bacterium]MCB1634879.1 50S ribosomal protein L29 [Xanthomonadales bacterium]MCB1642071.1 50S ribosomal protein L29 [Xanthomonadales bacterium]
MYAKDLRSKSKQELETQLVELRREQFNMRMQRAMGQFSQTHQVKRVRRDIARIKSVLGELQRKNQA